MVIAIVGESCTGKMTLAHTLKDFFNAEIFSGKDDLRLSRNEHDAVSLFIKKMNDSNLRMIYVVSEKEHLKLIPQDAFVILMKEELSVIKERFSQRLNGHLPSAVEKMLERKHGCFDDMKCNAVFTKSDSVDDLISLIKKSF